MHPTLSDSKPDFELAIEYLHKELRQIRTGRATPALVEDIIIDAYDAPTALKGIASMSVVDARTLSIQPWDKSLLKNIEQGIQKANIGINPVIDGEIVRISMPQMTEDNRKQLVKRVKEHLEETRVRVRGVREKTKEQIVKLEREKEMAEDEKFKTLEELEKLTREFIDRIESIGNDKEKEIMTI